MNVVRPLLADHIAPSARPLTVEVWRGDIAVAHECLAETDAVIGIEIIEHLHQSVLDKVPENVFGFIKPKVAIFSTPNAEYNVLFDGLLANGFRHDDHKFEWNRAEFEQWAGSICQRYPDYCVKFFGIGPAPPGSEAIGCVSQLALFVRKDFLNTLPDPPAAVPSDGDAQGGRTQPNGSGTAPTCWLNEETGEIMALANDPPPEDKPEGKNLREADEVPSPDVAVEGYFRMPLQDHAEDVGWHLEQDLNLDIDDECSGGEHGGEEEIFDIVIPEEALRAVRTRNDSGNFEEEEEEKDRDAEYWLVSSIEYPVAPPDHRTPAQRVRDEVLYQLRRLRNFGDDFFHAEQDEHQIPLSAVRNCMGTEQATMDEVRQILTEEGYRINADDAVCLPVNYSSDEEEAVDDFAEYDVDELEGWEENSPNECPNGAIAGMSLADDNAMWD